MDLNREACYRAVKARDRRFDGRFFIGVSSTGIFCRPICPARTPRFENCVFFPTAAAAYSAGFRPCLRCRPEISPGVPTWNGTVATVNRALRLIAEEGSEAANLEALASRLGVGSRHLRRLFRRHVGASPIAVLQVQRVMSWHVATKFRRANTALIAMKSWREFVTTATKFVPAACAAF